MENTSNKSNKSLYIVVAVVLLVLIVVGGTLGYSKGREDKKRDDDRAANERRDNDEKEKKRKDEEAKKMDYNNNVVGSYEGKSASVITPSLVFPVSSLSVNMDQTFKFEASKLDLALLGNEKLKVNNIYPTVDTLVTGQYMPNSDAKTYDFKVTSLVVSFKVADQVLNKEQSAALLAGLSQAGITLPDVSATKPATINTTVDFNNGMITVINTKISPITLSFSGTKKM